MFIPLRIRLLHNFGRSSFNIGFLFAVIGLAFLVFFSFKMNWRILMASDEDFTTCKAFISQVNETQYSVNENFLFEYHYKYTLGGEGKIDGSFLEYEGTYLMGQEIQIEYLNNAPEISRFSGKDRRNLDQIMFLAGILGFLVGFFFLYTSSSKIRKERKILMAGMAARGKLIHAEPTNMSVSEQTVYNLTFEYSLGRNKSQQFSTRSHLIRNLSDEHFETLIYDPRNPSDVVIIDTLPGPVARYVSKELDHM